ncbi:MAG TPA: TonB family protein [Polyangia bacterium]|nr:TonB family protein [Polyangia bacterium]
MKSAALVVSAFTVLGLGCGSDKAARKDPAGGPEFAMAKKKAPPKPVDPGASMTLDNEMGVMDTDDVEATLQDHFEDVRDCYLRAGKAQRYASGKVLLRFMVAGDGTAQDVWVLESSLGNYEVERCLVEVGRKIHFHAPNGNKATTFEYPVEFRSQSGADILDVDGPKVDRDLSVLLPQLAACGQLASEQVTAKIYIESNGVPGSVGLATAAPIDEDAGDCVVQTIRGWRMSVSLPGHVVSASFTIPSNITTAEASRRTLAHHRRR